MAITVPSTATGSNVLFQGRASSSQNITTTGAWAAIVIDIEDVDDLDGHSNTTNNTSYYVQRAGKYELSGVLHFTSGNAAGLRQACLYRNGAQLPGTAAAGWSTNTGAITTVATTPIWFDLAVGDFIQLAGQTGAAATTPYTQCYSNNMGYFTTLRIRLVR